MKLKKIPTSIKVIMASVLMVILTLGIIKANSVFAEPKLEDLVKERDYGTLQVEDKIDWENNSEDYLKVINQLNNAQVFVQLDAWKDTNNDKKITLDDVLYNRGKEDSEESVKYLAENIWSTNGGGTVCDYGSDKYYAVLLVDVDRWNNTVCADVTLGLNSVTGSVFKKSDYWFDAEHSCIYLKKNLIDSNDDIGLRCQTTYVCKNLSDISKEMPIVVTFDEKLTDSQKEAAKKAIKTSSVEIKSIVFNDDRVKFDIINDKNTILFNKDCLSIYVNGYSEADFVFDEETGEIQLDPQIKLSDIFFVGIEVKDVNEISESNKRIYEQQTQTANASYNIGWGDLPNSGITVKYDQGQEPKIGQYKLLEFQGWAGYGNDSYNDIDFYDNYKNPISGAFTKRVKAWYNKYKNNGHASNVAFVPFGEFTSSTVFYNIAKLAKGTASEKAAASKWFMNDSNMKSINKIKRLESVLCWDYNYRYIGQIVGMKKSSDNQSVYLLPNAKTTTNSEPFFTCTCMHINRQYYTLTNNYDYGTDFSGAIIIAGINQTSPNGGVLRCMIIPQRANTYQSFSQRILGFANIKYELQQKGKLTITKTKQSANIAIGQNQDQLNACKNNDNYKLQDQVTSVSGAVFKIYPSEKDANNNTNLAGTITTGSTNTVQLNAGTYYIKETKAPEGCVVTTSLKKVVIKAGEENKVTFPDPVQNLYLRMNAKDLTTHTLDVNGNAAKVGGLSFTVTVTNLNGTPITRNGKAISATAKTRSDGVLYFNLPCGDFNYTITQTNTTTNYSMADSVSQRLNEDSEEGGYGKASGNTITVTRGLTYDSTNGGYPYTVTGVRSDDKTTHKIVTLYWNPNNGKSPGHNDDGSYTHFNHWEPRQYVTITSQVQDKNRENRELTPAVVTKVIKVDGSEFTITGNEKEEYRYNSLPLYSVNSEYALYDTHNNDDPTDDTKLKITEIYDDDGVLNAEKGTCISSRRGNNAYVSAHKIEVNGKSELLPKGTYVWKTDGLETYNIYDYNSKSKNLDAKKAADVETIGAQYKLVATSDLFLGYNASGQKVEVKANETLKIVGVEKNTAKRSTGTYGQTTSNGLCESTEVGGKAYISAVIVQKGDHKYKIPNGSYKWVLQKASRGYYINANAKPTLINDTVWENKNKNLTEIKSTNNPVLEERQAGQLTVFTKGYDGHKDLGSTSNNELTNKMENLGFGKTAQGKLMSGDVNYYDSGDVIQVSNIKAKDGSSIYPESRDSFEVAPNENLTGAVFAIYNTSDIVTMNGGIIPGYSEEQIINMYNKLRLGDADMDDRVSICDATTIQRHASNMIKLLPYQQIIGDINKDGKVDTNDSWLIQKYGAEFEVKEPISEDQELTPGINYNIPPIGYYYSNGETGTLINCLGSDSFTYTDGNGNKQVFDAVTYVDNNADLNKLPLGSYLLVEVLQPADKDGRTYDIESWFEKQEMVIGQSTTTENDEYVNVGNKALAFYAPKEEPGIPKVPIAPDPVWPDPTPTEPPTEPSTDPDSPLYIPPDEPDFVPDNPEDPDDPYVEHDPDDPYDPDNPDKPDNPDDSDDIPVAYPEWVKAHKNDRSYRIVDDDNVVDNQHLVQDMLPAEFAFVVNDTLDSSRATDYYLFFYYEITKEEYDNQHESGKEFEYMEFDGMYFRRFEYADNQNIEGGANSVGARSLTNTIVLNQKSKGYKGYNVVAPNKTVSGAIKDVRWLNEKLTNEYYKGEYHIAVGVLTNTKRGTGGVVYETRRMLIDDVLTIKARQLFKLD